MISIIIATYNAGKVLDRCLDSVISQLTDKTELIIIDGKSKDNTIDIIIKNQQNISYWISEEDKGIYDAWNKGIRVAKGNWIMFLGADDTLFPDALYSYLKLLQTSDLTRFDYICARNEYVDKNGKFIKYIGAEPDWKMLTKGMAVAHVASLHNKKTLFETIGLYDLKYKICADYELLLRKGPNFKGYYLDKTIARMELGGVSFSINAIIETYRIRKSHKYISSTHNLFLFFKNLLAYELFKIKNSLK